nr:PilW family protein [uncultured Tolumonas sp.]
MKHVSGYTLIEWMISIVIGLFLISGLFSLYGISKETTHASLDNGELQENGRIGMNLILRDLHMAGFWGDYTGLPLSFDSGVSLSTAANSFSSSSDCLDTRSIGSFPKSSGNIRSVWIQHVNAAGSKGTALSCITLPSGASLSTNSDIVDIKRAQGNPISDAAALDANHFYIASNVQALNFFKGSEIRPDTTIMPNRQVWEYIRHIYYISIQNSVPELHLLYLTDAIQDTSIVRGVEKMRILFAVDNTLEPDGIIDAYITPESVTQKQWDERRVLGGRIFLLVRSIEPSSNYTNPNTYRLGDVSYTPADHYKRLLLQSAVMFNNNGDYTE